MNYLCKQLDLPPVLTVKVPVRKATIVEQRQNILAHLGFQKFEGTVVDTFQGWIEDQAKQGKLPDALLPLSQQYLLSHKIILPGQTVIEKTVVNICNNVHATVFETIYQKLTPELRREIASYLETGGSEQKSYFNQLKEYPPSARAKSIKRFLQRYDRLKEVDFYELDENFLESRLLEYLCQMAKKYNARDIKRFDKCKRYAVMPPLSQAAFKRVLLANC